MSRIMGKALFGLAVLALGAAAVWGLYGSDIRDYAMTPRLPFQASEAGLTPDYNLDTAWAAKPSRLDGADLSPSGAPDGDAAVWAKTDVFFIHDTTYASPKRWNAPIDGEAAQAVDEVVLANHASAFGSAGRLFVPRYRQATLYTFRTRSTDARSARLAAYKDTRRAFKEFLRDRPPSRPFILAGHGQGALHALGLLEELIAGEGLKDHLIAAYLIGHPIPLDLFNGPMQSVPPCRSPEQTGCIVSWNAYLDGGEPWSMTNRALVWDNRRLTPVLDSPILCTNPLTWRTDEVPASSRSRLGALPLARYASASRPGLVQGVTDAQCLDGYLRLSVNDKKAWSKTPYPARPSSAFDINLLYGDIRENAAYRARIFLATERLL